MIGDTKQIVKSLFDMESLEEVPLSLLQEVVERFPSFHVGHYLLSKKLQQTGSEIFPRQSQKTALHFNNAFWLQWLLLQQPETLIKKQTAAETAAAIHPEPATQTVDNFSEALTRPTHEPDEDSPAPGENNGWKLETSAVVIAGSSLDQEVPIPETNLTYNEAEWESFANAEPPMEAVSPTLAEESMVEDIMVPPAVEENDFSNPGSVQQIIIEEIIAILPAETDSAMTDEAAPAEEKPIDSSWPEQRESITEEWPVPPSEQQMTAVEPTPAEEPVAYAIEVFFPVEETPESQQIEPAEAAAEMQEPPTTAETTAEEETREIPTAPYESAQNFSEETFHPEAIAPWETREEYSPADSAIPGPQDPSSPAEPSAQTEEQTIPEAASEPIADALEAFNRPEENGVDLSAVGENVQQDLVKHEPLATPPVEKEEGLLFEPFHTIDYFASQGIKLSLDEIPPDRFGQQLKSFTDWLKVMKRLPAKTALSETNEEEDINIQSIAAHSNEEKEVVTETMADVLARQGKYDKAIDLYAKLSLLNPSKSAYFAARIEQLKNNLL